MLLPEVLQGEEGGAAQTIGSHAPLAPPKPTRLDPALGSRQELGTHPRLHPANKGQTQGLKKMSPEGK